LLEGKNQAQANCGGSYRMVVLNLINWFFKVANDALDIALPWLLVPIFFAYPVIYFIGSFKKVSKEKQSEQRKNKLSDLLSGTLILLFAFGVLYFIFWWIPQIILNRLHWIWLTEALRWIIFTLMVMGIANLYGNKYGGKRWLYSAGGHVAVLFIGWAIQSWIGIVFISIPLIAAYYAALYSLAIVILPASDPDDRVEKRKRFHILVSYAWGVQRPLVVVDGHAWKKPDIRIVGDIGHDFPVPGVVWTRSHQVVGITVGTKFKRVDGPGLAFTGKLERPLQVMDLRQQARTSEIDVVSKDGINFKARVVAAFRLDPDTWDQETYDQLRTMNPLLRGADRPSYTKGSFPFTHLRVQAAIGVTGNKVAGDASVYWDQWVLNVVEDTARQVISQKNLDELWRPTKDKKWANALDKIAEEIKESAILTVRAGGILLLGARVVNFRFPVEDGKSDDISEQQVQSHSSEWKRKRIEILAEAEAEAERTQQEAHAYAESMLLNSIAEGLQKTGEMHPRLPRYVIAMRYLSALQDYIHKQPIEGEADTEQDKRMMEYDKKIKELQTYFKEWQAQFSPDKEK
jgi:hypothetical protein